jgi:uncharacterized membrane protein YqjE
MLCSRFELFAIEMQEEKLRLVSLLIWLGVAMTLGAAGLVVIMGALAFWLWTTTGYWGLIGLALVPLAGAAGILWKIRGQIQREPPPFSETTAEFKKDHECLRKN